jgi:hypothetical protein
MQLEKDPALAARSINELQLLTHQDGVRPTKIYTGNFTRGTAPKTYRAQQINSGARL